MSTRLFLRSRLRYDHARGAFVGKVPVGAHEVECSLEWTEAPSMIKVEYCEWVERTILALEEEARRFCCQEMLPLKNEQWLQEGERALNPGEFSARLVLESISVGQNRSVTFTYGDGELFGGHYIEVAADQVQRFHYAGLLG